MCCHGTGTNPPPPDASIVANSLVVSLPAAGLTAPGQASVLVINKATGAGKIAYYGILSIVETDYAVTGDPISLSAGQNQTFSFSFNMPSVSTFTVRIAIYDEAANSLQDTISKSCTGNMPATNQQTSISAINVSVQYASPGSSFQVTFTINNISGTSVKVQGSAFFGVTGIATTSASATGPGTLAPGASSVYQATMTVSPLITEETAILILVSSVYNSQTGSYVQDANDMSTQLFVGAPGGGL